MSASEVRPGQIWADNDRRNEGRTVRVDRIEQGKALCTILTNSASQQRLIENHDPRQNWHRPQDTRGREARISLARMRPTSTGWRLLVDVGDRPSTEDGPR